MALVGGHGLGQWIMTLLESYGVMWQLDLQNRVQIVTELRAGEQSHQSPGFKSQ